MVFRGLFVLFSTLKWCFNPGIQAANGETSLKLPRASAEMGLWRVAAHSLLLRPGCESRLGLSELHPSSGNPVVTRAGVQYIKWGRGDTSSVESWGVDGRPRAQDAQCCKGDTGADGAAAWTPRDRQEPRNEQCLSAEGRKQVPGTSVTETGLQAGPTPGRPGNVPAWPASTCQGSHQDPCPLTPEFCFLRSEQIQ